MRGGGDERAPGPAEHVSLPAASPAISHRREAPGASPDKLDLTDDRSSSRAELSRAEDEHTCQRRPKRGLAGAVSLRSRGLDGSRTLATDAERTPVTDADRLNVLKRDGEESRTDS